MDEKSYKLLERLLEESRSSCYPTERNEIRDRYRDTALLLFKVGLPFCV